MAMKHSPCALYRNFPDDGLERIGQVLSAAKERNVSSQPVPVLFRADDVGVPSTNFERLLSLFSGHRLPLCLAVVPAWLTQVRWKAVKSLVDTGSSQWCWHQHGWRHANHQVSGKKSEFGPARSKAALRDDLVRGRNCLRSITGTDFSEFFTPPWNRCSEDTLDILVELGYRGVSRSRGEQSGPTPLADLFVNVDLHTRKEPDSETALEALCGELHRAIEEHYVAIMIHHQLMDQSAFALLDLLLSLISGSSAFKGCSFTDLAAPVTS